jgi:hypothetical protein
MDTILTVDGDDYEFTPPVTHDFWVDGWGWDLDGDAWIEFHEQATQRSIKLGKAVSVSTDDGGGPVVRAAGVICSCSPSFTEDGWIWGYRVRGFKYLMNRIPVTAVDGTGTQLYNLPPDDEDYLQDYAGMELGQIIDDLLTEHAAALTAIGVSTDATTTSQLAALDMVPFDSVAATGRLANAIDGMLQRYARNYVLAVTAAGKVRLFDTTALTEITLTEGTDPFEPVRFVADVTDCATRVVVRGKGDIWPAYTSIGQGTISETWTSGMRTAWTWADFSTPRDAYDSGTIAPGGILDPVTIEVESSNVLTEWDANFWPGRFAWLHLHSSIGSGITYTESRPITANTALTAGGTSEITVGFDLDNAGGSAYDSYEIIGTYAPIGSGGFERNNVYRLFDITDPGGMVADNLVKKFPIPVSFMSYTGDATAQTNYPVAVLVKSGVTIPANFKVLPSTGQILFDEPTTKPFNSQATLNTGGTGVAKPDDIYVLLAYSRGALQAVYPPDSGGPVYSGTAYTEEELERTEYFDVDSWVYRGNQARMDAHAEMLHASICDTVYSGNVNYRGAYEDAFEPGVCLSIDGNGYTTGLESAAVPIRSFSLRYSKTGLPQLFTSQLTCSNRRNPVTGDRQYVHPTRFDQTGFKFNWNSGASIDPRPYLGLGDVGAES